MLQVSRSLEVFDVCERGGDYLTQTSSNVTVLHSAAIGLSPSQRVINCDRGGGSLHYDRLCICTGGLPNVSTV